MQRLLIGTLLISLGTLSLMQIFTQFQNTFLRLGVATLVDDDPNTCSADEYGYVLKPISPPKWPTLCPGCNGERQSPIDIKTEETMYMTWDPPLQISNMDANITGDFKNDGKTIKWTPKEVNTDVVLKGGPLGEVNYLFGQFHMHWGSEGGKGSEHTLDGKQKAAEIHFVWFKEEYGDLGAAVAAGVAGDGDALSVIGVFIDTDIDAEDVDVAWFGPIEDAARVICEAEDQEKAKVEAELSMDQVIEVFEDFEGFYHYKGSLTTPDCFEIVNWIVAKNRISVRPAQLEPLRNLVFYTECEKAMMEDNFRSPDDLPAASIGNRQVEEYVQPPVVTCICEAENGAMWSMHPGFPFNGMLMNMGHVMDMVGDASLSTP